MWLIISCIALITESLFLQWLIFGFSLFFFFFFFFSTREQQKKIIKKKNIYIYIYIYTGSWDYIFIYYTLIWTSILIFVVFVISILDSLHSNLSKVYVTFSRLPEVLKKTFYWIDGITFVFIKIPVTRWGSSSGVMTKVLDCGLEVNEFKLQLCYYIHFWTNTLGKGMNPLISPAMG